MSATVIGVRDWNLTKDQDGHRNYDVTWLAKTTSASDGPATVMNASGLAVTGSSWNFGGSEVDSYALCWPTLKVSPVSSSKSKPEKEFYWHIDQKFSTRPINRCQDDSVENPLSEPDRVSGSYSNYMKPLESDRNGKAILSSSHEQITGLERDSGRHSVCIEQNVADLDLDVFAYMIHTLNDATLWGVAARKIKLGSATWERKLYGTCTYYYTRRFEFEVRLHDDDTFDIADVLDTGWKVLRGQWVGNLWVTDESASATNPDHFVFRTDRDHNVSPCRIPLNGAGRPLTNPAAPVYLDPIEIYEESNFLLLGIPTSF